MSNLVIEPKAKTNAKISAAEQKLRREALRQADAHNRIEGQYASPESAEIFEAFARGDIEHHEILQRLDALHRRQS